MIFLILLLVRVIILNTFDALYDALICLDCYRGLSFGSKCTPSSNNKYKRFSGKFKGASQGLVSAVLEQEPEEGSSTFTFHKDSWIGAVELEEKHVKHLHHIFRCPLCRTNKHSFLQCPILIRTFSITKLIVDDSKSDKKGSLLQLLLKTKIEIWVKLPLLPYLMYHLWKLLIMMWWITLSL